MGQRSEFERGDQVDAVLSDLLEVCVKEDTRSLGAGKRKVADRCVNTNSKARGGTTKCGLCAGTPVLPTPVAEYSGHWVCRTVYRYSSTPHLQ